MWCVTLHCITGQNFVQIWIFEIFLWGVYIGCQSFSVIFILTKTDTGCNSVGKVKIWIVGMRQANILHTV